MLHRDVRSGAGTRTVGAVTATTRCALSVTTHRRPLTVAPIATAGRSLAVTVATPAGCPPAVAALLCDLGRRRIEGNPGDATTDDDEQDDHTDCESGNHTVRSFTLSHKHSGGAVDGAGRGVSPHAAIEPQGFSDTVRYGQADNEL